VVQRHHAHRAGQLQVRGGRIPSYRSRRCRRRHLVGGGGGAGPTRCGPLPNHIIQKICLTTSSSYLASTWYWIYFEVRALDICIYESTIVESTMPPVLLFFLHHISAGVIIKFLFYPCKTFRVIIIFLLKNYKILPLK
jgi:hypothetical protein